MEKGSSLLPSHPVFQRKGALFGLSGGRGPGRRGPARRQVLSNNLGWAPQTYEDVVNLTEVLRGAPVSSVVVRMTLCGAHSFAYLVPTSGGDGGVGHAYRTPFG